MTSSLEWIKVKIMAKLRNKEIKELWRLGKTLQDIGDEFGITKQRVHQIIFKTKNNSTTVLKKIREAVFERDKYKCLKCDNKTRSHLTINHIVPRVVGGSNKTENLETLCAKCNRQVFAELTREAIKFYFSKIEPKYSEKIEFERKKTFIKISSKKLKIIKKRRNELIANEKENGGFLLEEIAEIFNRSIGMISEIINKKAEEDKQNKKQ